MTKLFHLGQYIRHDLNIWYSPCQVRVTDTRVIAQLEAEYRAFQRQHSNGHGPRPPMGVPTPHDAPVMRGPVRKAREKRQSGRVE